MTLDNSDSYTDWVADFPNSQCTREVDNSYTGSLQQDLYVGSPSGSDGFNCGSYGADYTDSSPSNSIKSYQGICNMTGTYRQYFKAQWHSCSSGGTWNGTLSGITCTLIETETKLFSSF